MRILSVSVCLFCCEDAVLLRRGLGWQRQPQTPLSIVFRLLLGLSQPGEEGCDRLEGYALALLLRGVLAHLPLVESILRDDVLVIQTVKEHPEKV